MSRSVSSKRDEVRQKVQLSRFFSIFANEPDRDFSPEELKRELEAISDGSQVDINTILKFLRFGISNGHVRLVPVDEKNRYRHVPNELSERFCGLNEEHHRMYALIEKYGDQGVWRGDLKKKANLDERQLAALLNELKKRQLIKEIVGVYEKKKKCFLWNVEPSAEVTGGIWYTGSQFNSQMVDETLIPGVARLAEQHPDITARELTHKVKMSAIGNLGYNDDEAEQLVTASIAAGKIAKIDGVIKPPLVSPVVCPISRTPCHGCPFMGICEPNGAINPVECVYWQKMIEEL